MGFFKSVLISGMISVLSAQLFAADPSKEEATAMVNKGIASIKANGTEKAFAAFSDSAGGFMKGELYIFAYDFNGVCIAHGQKPKLIGKNRLDVADVNGKKYIEEMVNLAKTKGSGWVDYLFQNPESKKIEPKTSYLVRVPEKDMFIACGIYLPK